MTELNHKALEGAAKKISLIFHPVFMPTLSIFLVLVPGKWSVFLLSSTIRDLVILLVFINTCLLPVIFSYTLKKYGFIKSLEMNNRQERWIPYFFTAFLYLLTYFLLQKAKLPQPVYWMQLGGIIAISLTALINFKWKISAHLVGVGGLTGAFYGLQYFTGIQQLPFIFFALFLAGIVGSSRLILGAHTPSQIYSGFFLGFICVAGVFFVA